MLVVVYTSRTGFVLEAPGFYDQPGYTAEFPNIGCGNPEVVREARCCKPKVIGPDDLPPGTQVGPDSGVRTRRGKVDWQEGKAV